MIGPGSGLVPKSGAANGLLPGYYRFGWVQRIAYQRLFPARELDVLGFAVAWAILSDHYRHNVDFRADRETVYELYYKMKVAPGCEITPDLYVTPTRGRQGHS